ncbi:RasGEF domain containing protein [Tritrichomonas foetus]|uniref:RasGEF domain containing protein n=1 Tax=Tritrichomonas foetus TaxID=1144522 RepID=A0A1J4K5Y1_9EUKA|nr:RasGEF domain containing protein [Tritrichomonas foetus]|eukprot:OHT06815.1 RasGEF domain containing protein [Tritrichomonas foetus]
MSILAEQYSSTLAQLPPPDSPLLVPPSASMGLTESGNIILSSAETSTPHKHKRQVIVKTQRKTVSRHKVKRNNTTMAVLNSTGCLPSQLRGQGTEKVQRKNKDLRKLVMSLNPFSPTDSDEENSNNIFNSPLHESPAIVLYSTLQIPEEDILSLKNLNTSVFPDEHEWIPNENQNGPKAASFNQLFLYLTSPDIANIDFQKQFLISFPSFATPPKVLAAIFTRYFADIHIPNSNIQTAPKLKQVRDRIIRILSTWMKLTAYQFTDVMLDAIIQFTDFLLEENSSALQAQILQASVDHLKGKRNQYAYTQRVEPPASLLPSIPEDKWIITMLNPIELARQVTLLHNKIFRQIMPMELLAAIWGSKRGGGSQNVEDLTKHFDIFSRYVQFSVINGENLKKRAKIFQWWTEVAVAFNEMKNYHGVFAVICGITHRSVQRLPDTMKIAMKMNKKLKKKYDDLNDLCDFSGDFRKYRPVISAAIEPCIPFIGCFQKDLIYVQEGYPNQIEGLTNFAKCAACISLINTVQRFQNERYDFIEVPKIQEMISSIPEPPDTKGMMMLSIEKEKKK